MILVRAFTEADDVAGFHASKGILTAEGGKASHAALVARGMGRPCVAGASALAIDEAAGVVRIGEVELKAGTDRDRGVERRRDARRRPPDRPRDQRGVRRGPRLGGPDAPAPGPRQRRHPRRMPPSHASSAPRGSASAAPSTCSSARTAPSWCGGCSSPPSASAGPACSPAMTPARTPRSCGRPRASSRRRWPASASCSGPTSRRSWARCAGLPVTIRLLDPPLHEFLPLEHSRTWCGRPSGSGDEARIERARAEAEIVADLQEANPMLGMRGIRLAINFPEVYEMQVRAVIGAAAESGREGEPADPRDHAAADRLRGRAGDPRRAGSRQWPRRRCARRGWRSPTRSGR